MSRLAEKFKRVSDGTKNIAKDFEAQADALLAKHHDLAERGKAAFEKHQSFAKDAEAGVTDIENALRELTNE